MLEHALGAVAISATVSGIVYALSAINDNYSNEDNKNNEEAKSKEDIMTLTKEINHVSE